jgi:hypothetical protein
MYRSPYSEQRSFKLLVKDKIAAKPEAGYKLLQVRVEVRTE